MTTTNRDERKLLEVIDIYGIDCGDGFTGVYFPANTSSCTH